LAGRGAKATKMNLHTRFQKPSNGLLAALPKPALTELEPYFTSVLLSVGTIVHEVGEEIEHIYFPTGGIASLQILLNGGRAIDTAMVGQDGVLGLTTPCRSKMRCVVRHTVPRIQNVLDRI
jgi:hypothetical protein